MLQHISPGTRMPAATRKKIQKLEQIIQKLPQEHYFTITRLTSLKSLCQNAETANHFVLYLAQRTFEKMLQHEPAHIDQQKWKHHQAVVQTAIEQMVASLKDGTQEEKNTLHNILSQLKQLQNTSRRQEWGPVRIIESSETLLVENAVECFLSPEDSSYWGYQTGRAYAERYNPRYGTGLIPESIPLLEDVVTFWYRYYDNDQGVLEL